MDFGDLASTAAHDTARRDCDDRASEQQDEQRLFRRQSLHLQ